MLPKVPLCRQFLENCSETNGQNTIFNKKNTFLLELQLSGKPLLIKTHKKHM